MLSFYPADEEVRLIPTGKEQLLQALDRHVEPIDRKRQKESDKSYLFTGAWNEQGFSISLKLKISNNFIPIISGEILDSEEGILIKSRFNLFPATKKLLLFWTVLTILITLFFVGIYQAWLYGAISLGFCLVNFILTRENFKIQVRKSKRMLDKMFSQ